MEARDICRRLNCSPTQLAIWVEQGCPVQARSHGWANYEVDRVREWLAEKGITDWPKEEDWTLDVPLRSLLKAVERREITPWEAEKVLFVIGGEAWV
jgi:hypothetical protein